MKKAVVFVCERNPYYLRVAIHQAESTQSLPVILLGDESNAQIAKNHYLIKDYYKHDILKGRYVHLSTNTFEFEYGCLKRWFVIKNFLLEHGIDAVWHCDIDVLLYRDLTCMDVYTNDIMCSVTKKEGPQTSYFTKEGLDLFCDFIIDRYDYNLQELRDIKRKVDMNNQYGGCRI